ncbi:MAG: HNH endonuclease, partial [Cyanobium sp.]
MQPVALRFAPAPGGQDPLQRLLHPLLVRHQSCRSGHPGGTDDLSNLQALCFRCNAGKRRPARGGLCVLRAGGQRAGAAGER